MKTIIEISPDREIRYEMPPDVYDIVQAALGFGMVKTIRAAVADLPEDLRRLVKVTLVCKPLPAGRLRGFRANVLIIDDYNFRSEYEQQPIPPDPKQSWSALGRPIFSDHSKGKTT